MGQKDITTKDYMKENTVFADAFNKFIYKGEQWRMKTWFIFCWVLSHKVRYIMLCR